MPKNAGYLERLWEICIPEPNSGCWLWLGANGRGGYSAFRFYGRDTSAHRASYVLHKGLISPGLHIDHLCGVRCCINPEHLEAVTPTENHRRSPGSQGAHKRAQTHCIHGHEFDQKNTYITPSGHRACRRCRNIRTKQMMERRSG